MLSAKYSLSPASVPCCAVCEKETSGSCRLIILSPCCHVFCSSCFTGTLNIVGEKNMSCMECKSPVRGFHFAAAASNDSVAVPLTENMARLPLSFRNSTNINIRHLNNDSAVLRIDNVPWVSCHRPRARRLTHSSGCYAAYASAICKNMYSCSSRSP